MNDQLKQEILIQLGEEEKRTGRKMKLRRYLAEVNPHLVKAQGAVAQITREDNPLDQKTLAAVNLAAALASRVPMCIRNNMVAAQNNGLSLDEIGAIMAAAQFITGTAVLSASLEGLQTIIGDLG